MSVRAGFETASAIHVAVDTRVNFVGHAGIVGSGVGGACARSNARTCRVGANACAASVMVAAAKAGGAVVEVGVGRVRHQVAVVWSWRAIVSLVRGCVATFEDAAA